MDPTEFHLISSPASNKEEDSQQNGGVLQYLLNFIPFGQTQSNLENRTVIAIHSHPIITLWLSFYTSTKEKTALEKTKLNPEDLKTKIFRQIPEMDSEIRAKERQVFNHVLDAFLFSISREEFQRKIDPLLQNGEDREFLDRVCKLLEPYREPICKWMVYHQKYTEEYVKALTKAHNDGIQIQLAFADEKSPSFDSQNIKVSFIRFYLALKRFQQAYAWMLPLVVCREEAKFATHILSHLVCGRGAPSLEEIGENLCCFKIEEFSNFSKTTLSLTPGQTFLDFIGSQFLQSNGQENRLKKMFEEALPHFLSDLIHRGDYSIKIGQETFSLTFKTQKDLDKPFFLEAILKHCDPIGYLNILSLDELRELFKKRDNPIIDKIFERLISFIEKLSFDSQNAAILKLMEMVILFSQQLFALGSNAVVKKMNEIGESNLIFGVSNQDNLFTFEVIPPQCNAINISGICPLSIQDTKVNQRIAPVRCAYKVEIPSLRGKENPVINITNLFFSPATPLLLLDKMKTDLKYHFDQEWMMRFSPEGLSIRFATLLEFLRWGKREFSNPLSMLFYYHPLFLQAFAIDQSINLFELMETIRKDELDPLMKIREELLNTLREAFDKIKNKFKDNLSENNYQDFVASVTKWFPELR